MNKPRILVVEDNAISRRIVRAILEQGGFMVVEAPDAHSAIAAVRAEPPDLIIQDMMLPDLDGVELTQRIRQTDGCSDIPIIILTGVASRLLDPKAIAARYSAWIVKPVDAHHLLENVRAYLPSDESENVGKGLALLIVDDDAVQLKLSRLHFMQLGFTVHAAESATRALELLRTRPIDAVLSDVLMPGIDGFELCMEIRRNAKFQRIPVLLVSASYQQERDRALARKAGANALLPRTPELEGVHRVILESVERGPPAAPYEVEADSAEISQLHALAARQQLDLQAGMNRTLARRCMAQGSQLALLGGMADALSQDTDTGVVFHDVLGAALDAAGISRGLLYLREAGGSTVACMVGYPVEQRPMIQSFFGHREILDAALAAGTPLKLTAQGPLTAQHREILDRAGASSLFVVPLMDQGDAIGALVLASAVSDVTAEEPILFARAIGAHIVKTLHLKQAFDRIAFTEARYLGLVENSGSGIIMASTDGVILNANATCEAIFGRPRQDLIGRSMTEFLTAADRDYAFIRLKDRLAGGPTGTEMSLIRPDRQPMTIILSSMLIDAGGRRVVLAIATDVTERNRLKQQAALNDKLATVGTLAAGIAHEINNPSSFIFNNLVQLDRQLDALRAGIDRRRKERQGADPGQGIGALRPQSEDVELDRFLVDSKESVRESLDGVERIINIVKGMKGFARIDDSEVLDVDINQVVETALHLTAQEARQRAQLVVELGNDLPMVVGSRGKLQQVIINLLVNAAQAIDEGNVAGNRIHIRTARDPEWVRIEITDSGKGIAPEHLTRIFDPFFTTKPVGVGTGLGLSICYEIVRHHGGELRVSSTVGQGTTFTLLLPVQSSLRVQKAPPPAEGASTARERARILIVDDEEALLKSFQRMLRQSYDVVTAHGGRAGLDAIRAAEVPYAAIISDLSMPDVSGMDLYRFVAESHPGMERRMIFMTGGAFTPKAIAFIESIDNPRLQKPFRQADLDRAISQVQERSH